MNPQVSIMPIITHKEAILTSINTRQGINGVDLILNCMGMLGPFKLNHNEYYAILANLVAEGEVVELEYTLPNMTYRLKSIYFPKGTKLYVNDKETTVKPNDSNNAQDSSV